MKNKKLIIFSVLIFLIAAELSFIYVKLLLVFPILINYSWIKAVIPGFAGMVIALIWNNYRYKSDAISKKSLVAVVSFFVALALIVVVPFNKVERAFSSNNNAFAKVKSVSGLKINDEITFGHYGNEDIKWIVLNISGDKALIISKDAVDAIPYNTEEESTNWEKSSIRAWLNDDFYSEAFSTSEQAKIVTTTITNNGNSKCGVVGSGETNDKIFLLSIDEAEQLFSSDDGRLCKPTDFAKSNGALYDESECCWWWLRTPGYKESYAATVSYYGFIKSGGNAVNDSSGCVRPVMWIVP